MISPFISKQKLSKKKKLGLALLEKLWLNLEVKFSWEIFKIKYTNINNSSVKTDKSKFHRNVYFMKYQKMI